MAYGISKWISGEPYLAEPADPAAGNNLTYTIPAGYVMQVMSVRCTLATGAAVANRQVEINYYNAAPTMFIRNRSNFLHAANLTYNYNAWPGGPPIAAFIAGTTDYYFSISPAVLNPGYQLRIEVLSIQAADQLSTCKLFFLRFRTV